MDKKIAVKNGIVMHQPDGIFNYFGWPSVTRSPNGELLAVSSGFRLQHVCPFGKVAMTRSRDEGQTWSPLEVVMDTPLDDRDAGITAFGNGKLIVTSFNNTRAMQRGIPNHTPERKAIVDAYLNLVTDEQETTYLGSTYRISEDNGTTWGPILKAPVSAPHGPSKMNDGSLFYVGCCNPKGDSHYVVHTYRSPDGQTWEKLGEIPLAQDAIDKGYAYCEPHGIQMPDGKIIVHIRAQTSSKTYSEHFFTVMQSVSTDGGHTWSEPVRLIDHGSPPHLLRHSSGTLISVYGYRNKPFGQRVMFSYDNGDSWEGDYILRDDGPSGDLGYPCSVELADGKILTVYYQQMGEDKPCSILSSIWELPKK